MKKFLAIFLVLSMIFCLGACGNEKDSDNDKNEKIEEQEDDLIKIEDIDDEESEEDDDKQSNKKTIFVGYSIYEPMNYIENGELVGFDTELAKAVFSNLGYKIEFVEIDWAQKYTELESGSIDCIWNGFTSNVAEDDGTLRSEKVDFSYYYLNCVHESWNLIEYIAVGFKKGSDLTSKVNEQLEELAEDGTMAVLAQKYGLSYAVVTDFSNQK